jgi:hypothetical protein
VYKQIFRHSLLALTISFSGVSVLKAWEFCGSASKNDYMHAQVILKYCAKEPSAEGMNGVCRQTTAERIVKIDEAAVLKMCINDDITCECSFKTYPKNINALAIAVTQYHKMADGLSNAMSRPRVTFAKWGKPVERTIEGPQFTAYITLVANKTDLATAKQKEKQGWGKPHQGISPGNDKKID